MTVSELIESLEYLDGDAEVRFASQPNWPFEYSIENAVEVEVEGKTVIFLEEGRQLGYLPIEAKESLCW